MEEEKKELDVEKEDDKAEKMPPADSGLPKTQEELDALLEKRLARERKKLLKQSAAAPEKATTPGDGVDPDQQQSQELLAVNKELLLARAQIEAYKGGIAPGVAEDAVYLALREVEKGGEEPDDDTMRDALQLVLKRHPEWKQEEKQKGGFKVGAAPADKDDTANKVLPKGKVIF